MMATRTGDSALVEQLRQDLARGTSDLPALTRGVTEALRLARMPGLDFDEVARVAASDPPLSARVVSVANSALYARAGMPPIVSVHRAAVRLGTQATRDVLFQVAYASMFVDAPRFRDLIEATFQHGVRVARGARLLASERTVDPDVAFLSGLLHDIGRARCWKLLAKRRSHMEMAAAVAAVDELHAAAGAELSAAWHLPDEVVETCEWHHDPGDRCWPQIVAAADAVSHWDDGPATQEAARGRILGASVPSDRVDHLAERLRKEMQVPQDP